jgi:hypothetical protein
VPPLSTLKRESSEHVPPLDEPELDVEPELELEDVEPLLELEDVEPLLELELEAPPSLTPPLEPLEPLLEDALPSSTDTLDPPPSAAETHSSMSVHDFFEQLIASPRAASLNSFASLRHDAFSSRRSHFVSAVTTASQKFVAAADGATCAAASLAQLPMTFESRTLLQSRLWMHVAIRPTTSDRSLGNVAAFVLVHEFVHVCWSFALSHELTRVQYDPQNWPTFAEAACGPLPSGPVVLLPEAPAHAATTATTEDKKAALKYFDVFMKGLPGKPRLVGADFESRKGDASLLASDGGAPRATDVPGGLRARNAEISATRERS